MTLQHGAAAAAAVSLQALLDRINEAYYLPDWCSIADYQQLFGERSPNSSHSQSTAAQRLLSVL
jgi:hypothetical protein